MPYCRTCGEPTTNFEDVKYSGNCLNCFKKQNVRFEPVIKKEEKEESGTSSKTEIGYFLLIDFIIFILLPLVLFVFTGDLSPFFIFMSIGGIIILIIICCYGYYWYYVEP